MSGRGLIRFVVFVVSCLIGCLTVPSMVFGQGNPTGTISGQVVSEAGVLPGVTVTVESPNLQGKRSTTTSEHGDYILALLPPGDYTVTFELKGFQTEKETVRVASGQTIPLTIALKVAGITEEITVTGKTENFSQGSQAATTYKSDMIGQLPVDRTLNQTVLLAPGVFSTGPSTNSQNTPALAISGAASFESLFLINGVVVNENVRGQALPLFIEDAIQETTIVTSGISAEFGRFSGGVVNLITKSGGNTFSGSYRATLNNDSWRTTTPFGEPKVDDTIPTHEITGGGPIVRDKLWFFGAARFEDNVEARQTALTNAGYRFGTDDKRYEGKVTYSITPQHTFRGSYIKRQRKQTNNSFQQNLVMDEASLYDRELPEDLTSLNYTGILTKNLFVEGQYSARHFTFKGDGSRFTDIIRGTLLIDRVRGTRYWSPTFCGVCVPEERDNENILLKANYFLSTNSLGSHNLTLGYDTFNDVRVAENHQSGSDFRILGTTSIIRSTQIFPVFSNDASTIIQWNPIDLGSQGTDFRTHSLFVNDSWRFNNRWTFNLGLRWDKNDGKDGADNEVVKDSAISPRLALTFDPTGQGVWTINASYGKYVAAIANNIADAGSAGGNSSNFQFPYLGPAINTDLNAPTESLTSSEQALRILFDWFNANGGTGRTPSFANLPGVTTRVTDALKSPSVHEWMAGATRNVGTRGLVRADVIYRDYSDFYGSFRTTATGQVRDPLNRPLDVTIIRNTDIVDRKYVGLNTQATYRVGDRLTLNGNYTLSKAWGTFNGETSANGPITLGTVAPGLAGPTFYPEYVDPVWNNPEGDLAIDQRHKARIWATYAIPIPAALGSLSVSTLESINSGSPYGAFERIDTRPFVTNPGYAAPPQNVTYYFADRDAFRTETVTRTDVSANYAFRFNGVARRELFFKVDVLNLFDEANIADINNVIQSVRTRAAGFTQFQAFNPFVETPVEGVHWGLDPQFGQPRTRFAYQIPRTLRVSMGIRF